ncbi:hypothetical protein [Pseudomonas rubra]|uniref:Uncharacterized protein n=1 Tax=Pseudomonas rubra TaxID=2942627 RepID=A0ABT5P1P1_9PSED|nr:hypothetical protein [Pseudomonas rubra]MDD1012188.1 hypothetical protein [Pseudomonas rubra]MDD1038376.1 hypothetical protein [Pseudomonas rubra]MDD1153413.1 hypothetical protein [Pseudomonas rubra]
MSNATSELTTDKVKLSQTRSALLYIAILSFLVFLVACGYTEDKPDTALFLMMFFVLTGLYVFIGTIETTILQHLIGLKASLSAWLLMLAYFTYVAKAQAMAEINAIFHVDASLFPMTLFATTALQVVDMLFLPVLVAFVITLGITYLWRNDFAGSYDGAAILITLLVGAGAQIIFAAMVWGWVATSNQKKATIYRVAHFADFNASFRCEGVNDAEYSVVFANPEKTKVLVAPKISELYVGPSRAQWLQPVNIPEEFPLLPCSSAAELQYAPN